MPVMLGAARWPAPLPGGHGSPAVPGSGSRRGPGGPRTGAGGAWCDSGIGRRPWRAIGAGGMLPACPRRWYTPWRGP